MPGVTESPKRSQDRVFKWVAAVAGRLPGRLRRVRGRPGPATPRDARLRGVGVAAAARPQGAALPHRPSRCPPLQGSNPVSLSAFRGTPVIVNFFASWCRTAGPSWPRWRASPERPPAVTVVGVDSNESSVATATRLLAAASHLSGRPRRHAKVATQYLVQALPVTYFLDAEGRVVGAALGPQTVASLDAWVPRLGGGRGERVPAARRSRRPARPCPRVSEDRRSAPGAPPIDRAAALAEGAPGSRSSSSGGSSAPSWS